ALLRQIEISKRQKEAGSSKTWYKRGQFEDLSGASKSKRAEELTTVEEGDRVSTRQDAGTQTPEIWMKDLLPEEKAKAVEFFRKLPKIEDDKKPVILVVTHLSNDRVEFFDAIKE